MQYQAYFLERTAENSVIGFCRPTEFLPAEFSGVRGIEQRMYKEQEKIKSKSHSDIQKSYVQYCNSLPTSQTLFFPVRVSTETKSPPFSYNYPSHSFLCMLNFNPLLHY